MFETQVIKPLGAVVVLRRICTPLLAVYLVIGMIAAYRAWYQVRSLNLSTSNLILRAGTNIESDVVSYARTPVDVRIELIQGTHIETISFQHVTDNEWAFFDPRNQRASQTTILSADLLARFAPGQAQLRATAIGRPQWMRLPPPVVRELTVEIPRN